MLIIFLFLPIFVSIDVAGGVSLSRPGAYYDGSQFITTFPIGLVFIILLFFFKFRFALLLRWILLGRIRTFAMQLAFVYFVGLVVALFFGGLSSSLVIETACFAYLIYLVSGGGVDISLNKLAHTGFLLMAVPGVIASIIVGRFSFIPMSYFPGEIWPGIYAIYNFEQYYAISLFLALGILMSSCKSLIRILVYFSITLFIACASENTTALILTVIGFFSFCIVRFIPVYYGYFLRFYFVIAVLFFFSFPIFSFLIFNGAEFNFDIEGSGFIDRMYLHAAFVDNFKIENMLIPANGSEWFRVGRDVHHQFILLLSSAGLLCAISYYSLLIYVVLNAKVEHRFAFISLCLVAATMVEPLNHPFLMFQFYVFLGSSYFKNELLKAKF